MPGSSPQEAGELSVFGAVESEMTHDIRGSCFFRPLAAPRRHPSTPAAVLTKQRSNSTFLVLASSAAALRHLSALNLGFLTGNGDNRAASWAPGTAAP